MLSLSGRANGIARPGCRTIKPLIYRRGRTVVTHTRYFKVSEEVQQALAERRPVIALESTIYTHGFPYPDNLALASRLESVVRINGGVPATIGILDGVARVGLEADELIRLVQSAGGEDLMKVSRRDFGFALGLKSTSGKYFNGGTTVSATMILAHMAGISVFATGGLGGVHRGAESTMDISADLTELGRTAVAVVSSGCKSFLDIPKTLEFLETQGVGVATFADGRTGSVDFPAFYTRDSGVPSPLTVASEVEAARVIHAHKSLGLQSGLLFANPIAVQHGIPKATMDTAIDAALAEAARDGVFGATSTPYILAKIKDLTDNKSVVANKTLVEANVKRGTIVAKELRKLEMDDERGLNIKAVEPSSNILGPAAVFKGVPDSAQNETESTSAKFTESQALRQARPASIFVAGTLALDFSCDYAPLSKTENGTPQLRTSNPAVISQSVGGVGHNVARAAHLMGGDVRLCSAVGDDLMGKAALNALDMEGMSQTGIKTFSAAGGIRTGQYVAVNDKAKNLVLAMADMSILELHPGHDGGAMSEAFADFWIPQLRETRPSHLVLDANWPPQGLARWLEAGKDVGAHISFEPVSNAKSAGIFKLAKPHTLRVFPNPSVNLATPNVYELSSMYKAAKDHDLLERQDWWEIVDAFGISSAGARTQLALATTPELVDRGVPQQSIQLLPFIPTILTKLGRDGVLLTQILPANDPRLMDGAYAPHILSRCNNGTEDTLGVGGVYMRLFPAVEQIRDEDMVSVNGVGDTFAGTLIAGLVNRGKDARVEDLVDLAQRAACLTLRSKDSVSPGLGTLRILL